MRSGSKTCSCKQKNTGTGKTREAPGRFQEAKRPGSSQDFWRSDTMRQGTEMSKSVCSSQRRGAGWDAGGALRVLLCAVVFAPLAHSSLPEPQPGRSPVEERSGASGGRGQNVGAAGSSQGDGPGGALPGGGGRVGLSDPLQRALGFFAEAAERVNPGP